MSNALQGDEPSVLLAVIIPCYRVAGQLEQVLNSVGNEVHKIYCVVDGCDSGSGAVAEKVAASDLRIRVLYHAMNLGVGAACITGYQHALREGATVMVKIDGDGQMSPADLLTLVRPILSGQADYVKANRFSNLENLRGMPRVRLTGNLGLSFLSKLSSGYWNIFDPTNGFTAMHWRVASMLPWDRISKRYFFESDLLFRLNTLRAVTIDRPLPGRYADERSSLSVWRAACEFPVLHLRNFFKRLFYCYLLRDFNIASLNLLLAIVLLSFGLVFGMVQWVRSVQLNEFASAGTVMLAALPFILGWQALLAFFSFDLHNIPSEPVQRQYL